MTTACLLAVTHEHWEELRAGLTYSQEARLSGPASRLGTAPLPHPFALPTQFLFPRWTKGHQALPGYLQNVLVWPGQNLHCLFVELGERNQMSTPESSMSCKVQLFIKGLQRCVHLMQPCKHKTYQELQTDCSQVWRVRKWRPEAPVETESGVVVPFAS